MPEAMRLSTRHLACSLGAAAICCFGLAVWYGPMAQAQTILLAILMAGGVAVAAAQTAAGRDRDDAMRRGLIVVRVVQRDPRRPRG